MTQQTRSKRPDYVTVLAVCHLAVGALTLLAALAVVVLVVLPVVMIVTEPVVLTQSLVLFGFLVLLLGLVAVATVVVGIGLLGMRRWARWAAIAVGLLILPGVPIGTAVGVLTLVYLLSEQGRQAFEPQSTAP